MNALWLTVFVSMGLALLGVLLFLHSASQKDRDHLDRLALLPLEDDDGPARISPHAVAAISPGEAGADPKPHSIL